MNNDLNWLANGLRTHTAALASAAGDLAPDAPVPTCPKWQVRDLVGHIGQAHRWAAGIVRTGTADATPDPLAALPGEPPNWPAWLAGGATELIDAVLAADPDRPVWTYLGEWDASFWLRRMLHDTVVHSADAAIAAEAEFTVAPDIAEDTISEALGIICDPAAAQLKPDLGNLRGTGSTIQLRPTDIAPGWLITRTPDGPAWTRASAGADVVLSAPVAELMLVFARRRGPAEATVTGDTALLTDWLANTSY